jgi:hypothetical protein
MHNQITDAGASENLKQTPIWFAALVANQCEAVEHSRRNAVSWRCCLGKALYTNSSRNAEHIHPLGVSLRRGDTLAVWWQPGEAEYRVKVYSRRGIAN